MKHAFISALVVVAVGLIPAHRILAASSPPTLGGTLCDKILDAQSAVAECTGSWDTCLCPPQAPVSCCTHEHGAMNWKSCIGSASITNKKCGPPTKKYYSYRVGNCQFASEDCHTCYQSPWARHTSGEHYEDDYTLLNCETGG